MRSIVEMLEKISLKADKVLVAAAGSVLVLMMLLAAVNVALRNAGFPVKGTFEMMGFLGAIVASFGLGRTFLRGEHIAVDVLIVRFPRRVREVLTGINDSIAMVFFGLAAFQTFRWATTLCRVDELSETLRIPYFPFVYGVSLGCFFIGFVLMIETLKWFMREWEG